MKLITISGVDGSGKSTQIKLLQKHLESYGNRVFYFHAIQSGIAQKIADLKNKYCLICRFLGKCRTNSVQKSVTKANWLQIQMRKMFFRIDVWRFKLLYKKLDGDGFDFLLSDRYFFDTVINLEYLMKKSVNLKTEKFIMQPDAAIYLEIAPQEIMQRNRRPDQGVQYLQEKVELFKKKKSLWKMRTISATEKKEVVFEKVLNVIKEI